MTVAILDIDGTLVDTNYQHALAWFHAFRETGVVLPIWEIHRAIGIGSDKLVTHVAGEDVERENGDALRDAQSAKYADMIDDVEPMAGAHDLLSALKRAGHPIVLASSAATEDAERYLDLLDARDLVDAYTTSDVVENSKPDPDIVRAALDKSDADAGVMIGDSTWDCRAAHRAGLPSIGVLTGGFSEQELTRAHATRVFDSVDHLREYLVQHSLDEVVSETQSA